MSDLANIKQQIAQMRREHFRELADLRERVVKLERENKNLIGHVPEARQMVEAWGAKGGAA